MSVGKVVALASIVAAAALPTSPAGAWDGGCSARAVTCYEKVRRPDVYATVARPVVLEPARREIVQEPAVIQNRPYRVAVVAPRWHAVAEPAKYMTLMHRELVHPAQVHYVQRPPVVARVTQTVTTRPTRLAWRHSLGRDGAERLCAERIPGRIAIVTRNVVIEPARRVAVETPAVYHEVARSVLVSPGRVRHVYDPGRYAVVTRPVVLKPGATVIVDHPPVLALQEDRVLARRGGYEWRPVDDRRW